MHWRPVAAASRYAILRLITRGCAMQFCVGTIEEDYLGVIGMPNE